MELLTKEKVEQIEIEFDPPLPQNNRWAPAAVSLELGVLCMRFAHIERVPRYDHGERENDAEHSYMLSVIAPELAHLFYPDLNKQLIGEYAKVHDLIEIVTGDVATFNLSPEQLATKEQIENDSLETLLATLPPYTASLLRRYEAQADPEARFVRAVDKLMPVIVDIIGQGKRVMKEDYGVHSATEIKESHAKLHDRIARKFGEFTVIIAAHRQLCDLFEAEFSCRANYASQLD